MDRSESCPSRIWMDIGAGLGMGFIGGLLLNRRLPLISIKRILFRRSKEKSLKNTILFLKGKARPFRVANNFACWIGTFSSLDCLLQHYKGKDSAGNVILSGGITTMITSSRGGFKRSFRGFLFGAFIMSVIEFAIILLKLIAGHPEIPFTPGPLPPLPPGAVDSSGAPAVIPPPTMRS